METNEPMVQWWTVGLNLEANIQFIDTNSPCFCAQESPKRILKKQI